MSDPDNVHRVRKYPNRRFYDTTTREHMGLENLYDLVRAGHTIQVTDSHTGEDITSQVLTQLILDHEGGKLVLFPSSLLHQVIQANQQLLRSFVDRYFNQAFSAFLESKAQYEEFLRRAGTADIANPFAWARQWVAPGMSSSSEPAAPTNAAPPAPAQPAATASEIQQLRNELAEMSMRLEALQASAAPEAAGARARPAPQDANPEPPRTPRSASGKNRKR